MSEKKSSDVKFKDITKEDHDKGGRFRNWSFIMYPESMPDDYLYQLELLQVPVAISPLHDQDINELDDEQKKPHYHVILCFEGKKSYEQVREISVDIFHGTVPKKVNSLKGATRYLTHMDNPEKHRYPESQVKVLYGFDYDSQVDISNSRRYELIGEMLDFIVYNDVRYYCDLLEFAKQNREDWFHTLMDHSTYCIVTFINDRSKKFANIEKREVR